MQPPYRRYEDIELIIPAGTTAFRIQFPDIPQLRSDTTKEILIRSIRVFGAEECPLSFNGNPLLDSTDLAKIFLTLYVDGEESIFRIPFNSLRNTYVGVGSAEADNTFWSASLNNFDNISVDWTKSYISLSEALSTDDLACILLGIGYLRVQPGTLATIATNRENAAKAGILTQM